jgi:ubiquinone/menaquinone biosynthesis C-methylase UbiE
MLGQFALHLFQSAEAHNHRNILELSKALGQGRVLDLGCGDGEWTSRFGEMTGTTSLHGLDIDVSSLSKARQRGVRVASSDLTQPLPFAENTFALVHSNQVIEHLPDVDLFVQEIFRVLQPGGWAVVSTENLSSWHNIAALVLGRQAFSQHISAKTHVGNEWALHAGEALRESWTHMKIFTWYGLRDLFNLHGFRGFTILGAGYHPLPAGPAAFVSRVDPIHTHFITIRAQKDSPEIAPHPEARN